MIKLNFQHHSSSLQGHMILQKSLNIIFCVCVCGNWYIFFINSSSKNENSVIIYSLSRFSKPIWISFFRSKQNKLFWRMLLTKQLMVAIDFHCIFSILWKSMATVNCLVANILQNIFFCVHQNNEIHAGLEWVNDEKNIHFWLKCPFKVLISICTLQE